MRRPRRQEACDDSIDPSTKQWGSLATDVRDSRGCLAGCRERFAADVLGGSVSRRALSAETIEALCAALVAQAEKGTEGNTGYDVFYRLYCCDSVVCGVWYNETASISGQDPNVNRIISTCEGLGYRTLRDPGLPQNDFTCPDSSVYLPGEKKACPKNSVGIAGFDNPPISDMAAPPPSSEPVPTTDRPSILFAPTTIGGASLPSSTITNVAFDFPSGDDGSTLMAPLPQQSGLTPGVKATIAVTSIVGSLALLSLILCLRRRGTHHSSSRHLLPASASASASAPPPPPPPPPAPLLPQHSFQYSHSLRSSSRSRSKRGAGEGTTTNPSSFDSSPTRVVSSSTPPASTATTPRRSTIAAADINDTDNASNRDGSGGGNIHDDVAHDDARYGKTPTMTFPPLRLKDRRLLPTFAGSVGRRQQVGKKTGVPARSASESTFPTAPICAPTTNKLEPRLERGIHGLARTHPVPTRTHVAAGEAPRGGKNGRNGNSSSTSRSSSSNSIVVRNGSSSSDGGSAPRRPGQTNSSTPSPPRPPRPHETPLEIPGLVSPAVAVAATKTAGRVPHIPWNLRSLPPPPPPPPSTPPPVPTIMVLPDEIGLAVTGGNGNGPGGGNPESSGGGNEGKREGEGVDSGGAAQKMSSESQDLCDLTEECAREERESWGMFRSGAGGAPGVSGREAGVVSPVLGDGELERLGGKYN